MSNRPERGRRIRALFAAAALVASAVAVVGPAESGATSTAFKPPHCGFCWIPK